MIYEAYSRELKGTPLHVDGYKRRSRLAFDVQQRS